MRLRKNEISGFWSPRVNKIKGNSNPDTLDGSFNGARKMANNWLPEESVVHALQGISYM